MSQDLTRAVNILKTAAAQHTIVRRFEPNSTTGRRALVRHNGQLVSVMQNSRQFSTMHSQPVILHNGGRFHSRPRRIRPNSGYSETRRIQNACDNRRIFTSRDKICINYIERRVSTELRRRVQVQHRSIFCDVNAGRCDHA